MPRALLEIGRALPGVTLFPVPVQPPALRAPAFSAKLAANDRDLRGRVVADPALEASVGDPWAEVGAAMATYGDIYLPYTFLERNAGSRSSLYDYAVAIVRSAEERQKADGDRLPEYTQSALPLVEKRFDLAMAALLAKLD